MCTINIDAAKVDAFGEKLIDSLNSGALSIMISIGHRSGLFDTMSILSPATSVEIAEAAGLNERYVREWLGAMTVGKIIKMDPLSNRYSLPAEHSALLTRSAGADNIAVFSQYIGLMGGMEEKILHRFKNGGGVPYSEFPRFHEVMAEDSGQSVVSSLLEYILPLIPGIKEKLEEGIEVLDLGCGRGVALNLLAKTFPNSSFTGYDLSEEAIKYANEAARKDNLKNISYGVKDLTNYDVDGKYDLITTFDAIHDQARPDIVLSGIYSSLKDDGYYLMQDIKGSSSHHEDIEHPLGALLYTISCTHCMTVSLAQNGMGLGAMWGKEKAFEMLREAGFRNIEVKELEHDIQNFYYVIQK